MQIAPPTRQTYTRKHTPAYASIRQHTPAYVSIPPPNSLASSCSSARRHVSSAQMSISSQNASIAARTYAGEESHRTEYEDTYIACICPYTTVYVCPPKTPRLLRGSVCEQHAPPAYVSIRQHTSAHVSTRQHTSAYASIRQHTLLGNESLSDCMACAAARTCLRCCSCRSLNSSSLYRYPAVNE
jgi:hypothetical protein